MPRLKVLFPRYRVICFLSGICCVVLLLAHHVHSGQESSSPICIEFPLPKTLSVCGEPMPLDDPAVREMLDREFTINVWDRAQVFMWLKRKGRYFPYIEKATARAALPEDLKYLAVAESSLLTHVRSHKGATGTWQFMAYTARRNGLSKKKGLDERRNFEMSTDAAMNYLQRLKEMFGTWTLALAAYNLGESRLKKEMKAQKENNYYRLELPLETERFIFRIAAIKIILEDPERYGYRMDPERVYHPVQCDRVKIKVSVPLHITEVAKPLGTSFKMIKELNPQILGYYMPIGTYSFNVPSGTGSEITGVLKRLSATHGPTGEKITGEYYLVRQGDTLIHISRRSGVSVDQLRDLNDISGSLIKVGQKLRLAP